MQKWLSVYYFYMLKKFNLISFWLGLIRLHVYVSVLLEDCAVLSAQNIYKVSLTEFLGILKIASWFMILVPCLMK